MLDVKQLTGEHARSGSTLCGRESLELERRVSDLVNAASGLAPADGVVMRQTDRPRVPIPAPSASL